MDVCELEKASENQSTGETTRQPLGSANNKNGSTRRSQTREVSSRYMSPPPPSAANGPNRCPSPIVGRKSTTSFVSVSTRAVSAERKRPSAPSSPRSPSSSTPVRDTAADTLLASRKTTSSKMPESLWPSTMRSLGSSFQSDSGSLPVSKREKTALCMPSDRTLRPTSNVASDGESSPSQNPTPLRKTSPPTGKSSADQLENSKPADSLNDRLLEQHRWPSWTSGKTFTGLSKSDIIDKMDKSDITDKFDTTTVSSHSGTTKPSSRRLSLGGTIKSDATEKTDKSASLSRSGMLKPPPMRVSLDGTIKSDITIKLDKTTVKPFPRRLSLDGATKGDATDQIDKMPSLSHCGTGIPSPRKSSLDAAIKIDASDKMTKTSSLSHSGMAKPSPRRLSLDGTTKSDATDQMDKMLPLSRCGTVITSPRKSSLDAAIKSDASVKMHKTPFSSQSETAKPSPRRLSLDGTIKSDGTNQVDNTSSFFYSRMVMPSRTDASDQMDKTSSLDVAIKSHAGNQMDQTSSLSNSKMVNPSPRRLSLHVAIKSDANDHMDNTSPLTHSGTVKSPLRRFSLDPTTKIDTIDKLGNSGKSPPSRLSLDEESNPSKKSATDLLFRASRDDDVKDMLYGRPVDEGLPRIQRPSSSSSSDKTSSISAASRTQSVPIAPPRLPFLSVSRGASPSQAKATIPSTRGTSPARLRPSSPSRQSQNPTSVLTFIADVKKGNLPVNCSEDVHQLKLSYTRYLQWRFANARADATLHSQKVKAEKMLYSMWRIIADSLVSMRQKKCKFQQLGLRLKLYSVLHSQVTLLNEWASIERDHMNSLTRLTQNLQASTILIPLGRGARGDANSVKAALYSAAHVIQSVASSLCSGLSKVEEINRSIIELAEVAALERARLNECESLLSSTDAYQVEECYLRTLVLQMKQGC